MKQTKCDLCGEVGEKDNFRKICIYEPISHRFRDEKYIGNTKVELCLKCLSKIGYKPHKSGVKDD